MSLRGCAREPFDDYLAAIDRIRDAGLTGFALMAVAAGATWFVYVPLHELMHAWGCLATGGTVTRLDIAPEYGGAWLATILPFVRSGSEYAGQLVGFDTHGNDATYLATVLAPYLLTIAIGVPLMKSVGRVSRVSADNEPHAGLRTMPPVTATSVRPQSPLRLLQRMQPLPPLLLGVALILAYAPAISLMGDYYEAGSIVVSRAAHRFDPSIDLARWRSDDVFKLIASLNAAGASVVDWIGVGCSFVLGVLLALSTYRLGSLLHRVATLIR